VTVAVTVSNRSAVVDLVNVYVVGIPQEWVTVVPPQVPLFPGARSEAAVTIAPPRAPHSRAGEYHLAIAARSDQKRGKQAAAPATIIVRPLREARAELRPRQRRGWRQATYRLELANLGNRSESLALSALDDEDLLDFVMTPSQPMLAPGEAVAVRVAVATRG
jgi:hypothetical protein